MPELPTLQSQIQPKVSFSLTLSVLLKPVAKAQPVTFEPTRENCERTPPCYFNAEIAKSLGEIMGIVTVQFYSDLHDAAAPRRGDDAERSATQTIAG